MKKLHLFTDFHDATDELATETIGLLGRKGSGKTYGSGVLVEEFVAAGIQVVEIDPVGKSIGLRLSADGKHPGLDMVIVGGLRGDIPLNENAGVLVADLVVDSGRNFIIDISQFSKGARKKFCTQFGEQLWLRRKAQLEARPLHIVLEEAQLILPQMLRGEVKGEWSEARMLGVWEEICRLGRNYGIGVTLISQRPQSINNEALTQIEILICFQLNGLPERKTLKDWVTYHGLDVNLVEQLPKLGIGANSEAFLWSPSVLKVLVKVHFRKKHTYDSSATPKVGQTLHRVTLKAIDLGAIKEKITALEAEAKANDPSALRRRVLVLEQELTKAKLAHPAPAPTSATAVKVKTEVKRVEVPILKDSQANALERSAEKMAAAAVELAGASRAVTAAIAEAKKLAAPAQQNKLTLGPGLSLSQGIVSSPNVARRAPAQTSAPSDGELNAYARSLLVTFAQRHPMTLSRSQLAVLSGRSTRSSAFDGAVAQIKRGYVEEVGGGTMRLTEAGIAAVGGVTATPQTSAEVLETWRRALPAYERALFDVLVSVYPDDLTREQLAEKAGKSTTSSAFDGAISSLKKNHLVVQRGTELAASDTLFDEAKGAA